MPKKTSPSTNKLFSKKSLIILFLVLILLFAGFVGLFYFSVSEGWVTDMPSDKELREIQNYTASEVYSSDGVLLGKYFVQDRTNVAYEDISKHMIQALIATEDARFYQHTGVDNIGLLRVFFKSILLGDESAGGGSTLSQQLAKNLFAREKYWMLSMPINKLKEMLTAKKLERIFSKKEILALYLNTVSFGENAFGVEAASKRFFNTSSSKLNIEQAAMLVGMLKATNTYNPRKNYEKSLARRNIVLDQMVKNGFLEASAAQSLKDLPIKLNYKSSDHSEGPAPYFREFLRQELVEWCSKNKKPDGSSYNLYTDGLKIYTTIDSRMQRYAEAAVREHMAQLQRIFYAHWGKSAPWIGHYDVVTDAKRRSERYKLLKEQGKSQEEIKKIFATPVKMKVFTWGGELDKEISPLDSIKHYLWMLRAGFMSMDPQNGYIKAWVGGLNYKYFQYDQVNINAKRQAGSTFKPIVYAAALESGVDPCEYISNERSVFANFDNWSPRNSSNTYGGMYSMSGALTNSVNTISAQLILKAGINRVIGLARRMGIRSELEPIPSLALGTADVSLYEMVAAYGTFANRGVYTKPMYLLKIENNEGKVILNNYRGSAKTRALNQQTGDMIVSMLQNVVNDGTASRLRSQYKLNFQMAGKTGTTQSQADGWFVGFTPRLVSGAWVGGEDRRIHFRSIELGQGASMALPIWARFMSKIARDKTLSRYAYSSFAPLSEAIQKKLDCDPYLPPKDSLNFFQRLFYPRNKNENQAPKPPKEKSEKYKETFDKIRNMFRRKR